MTNNLSMEILGHRRQPLLNAGAHNQKNAANGNFLIMISDIIFQLGIPVHTKGYIYLREAIDMKLKAPQEHMPVTKVLYPGIAKKYNTSAEGVERVIRHAIKVAWENTEKPCWNNPVHRLFRCDRKPTNAQLIATVAEHITLMCNLY